MASTYSTPPPPPPPPPQPLAPLEQTNPYASALTHAPLSFHHTHPLTTSAESSTWNLFHRLSRSRGSSSPPLLSPTDFDRLEQMRLSAGPPGAVATSSSTNNSGSEAVDEGDAGAGCVFSSSLFDTKQEFDPQLFAPKPPRGGGGVARADPMDRASKRAEMLARREYQG